MDLGSGMGKAVFAAHLYFQFGTCKGIEFLDDLHANANTFARSFDNEVAVNNYYLIVAVNNYYLIVTCHVNCEVCSH